MNRREFMMATAAFGTGLHGKAKDNPTAASGGDSAVQQDVPPRNRHPYKDLDWRTVHQIKTTSHVHCTSQKDMDVLLKRGLEFITLSNYYPSAPWYPLSKMTENYYRLHHEHPVVVNRKRMDGPFDWNAIVGRWVDELPEEQRSQYPFKEGGKIFRPLPDSVMEAPNAEHHSFRDENGRYLPRVHINAPGSMHMSGTFDRRHFFQVYKRGGHDFGCGEPWPQAIDRMLAALIHPDGGGVTLNHPRWTSANRLLLLRMLDYDPRVLGIEVIEGGRTNSEGYWDWILATGRQCFGFFVPDHDIRNKDGTFGVNILLTPERTVQGCLRAYRQGNFYGAKRGLDKLKFTRIAFDGNCVEAETDRPAQIEVKTSVGTVARTERGTSVKWTMEGVSGACGPREKMHVFARVKAYSIDGSGEELFSQPYMLVPGIIDIDDRR